MVFTCRAIVKEVVGHGVEEQDRKRTWMADAGEAGLHGRSALQDWGTTPDNLLSGHVRGVVSPKRPACLPVCLPAGVLGR
jgi:hypothetical protein